MLRDKNIEVFDDNNHGDEKLKLIELCNIECVYASHNKIRDIRGICQLTTLVELNLSFNRIIDITGIEELTLLRVLLLNQNELVVIEPLKELKGLKQLGLYHNKLLDDKYVLSILSSLPKLREVTTDGNPCARLMSFTYELILRIPKLRMHNDEAVKELDRDIATQFFEDNELPVPQPEYPIAQQQLLPEQEEDVEDTQVEKEGKHVRFKMPAGDVEDQSDWQNAEIKRLTKRVEDLEMEKFSYI